MTKRVWEVWETEFPKDVYKVSARDACEAAEAHGLNDFEVDQRDPNEWLYLSVRLKGGDDVHRFIVEAAATLEAHARSSGSCPAHSFSNTGGVAAFHSEDMRESYAKNIAHAIKHGYRCQKCGEKAGDVLREGNGSD